MEGDLSLLSIPDLLQMICLGRYSRDIHLFEGQTQLGVIAIRNGRVDRCFGYGTWGEAAFFKLVNLRRGRYKVNDAQDMSASDATLTAYSWQELLMEAARQQDEAALALQVAEASSGRVIPFPSSHFGGSSGTSSSSDGGGAGGASMVSWSELNFDFSPVLDVDHGTPVSAAPASSPVSPVSSVSSVSLASSVPGGASAPLRSKSDTGRQSPVTLTPVALATPLAPIPDAPAVTPPPPATSSMPAASTGSTGSIADDVMNLMQEATACYLRRDLARAEALLQKCLELRPGDKRALQNLDRIRRKKPQ
jgi:hypothetical protein